MASLRATTSTADLFSHSHSADPSSSNPSTSRDDTTDGQTINPSITGLGLGLKEDHDTSAEQASSESEGDMELEPKQTLGGEDVRPGDADAVEGSNRDPDVGREGGVEGGEGGDGAQGDEGMILQVDSSMESEIGNESDEANSSQEILMSDPEAGPSQGGGKRVKVYELRENSWFDRGTGHCKGVYDDTQDLAMLIVEAEISPERAEEEGEGGFLKEELLLSARVEKDDIYSRQQDTLIVWTEPATNLDIALSFQDAEGCEDIWQFMCEVRRHLNGLPNELDSGAGPSSSSPLSGSPVLGVGSGAGVLGDRRTAWDPPTLANVKSQELLLRMQAKSAIGRERAVEHIISEDYIKQLIVVFDQAEDLESLEDLHALCSLMQTILLFNDNTIFEYILQDGIFMGVIGMLEYDPEFPNLKASYRQFFDETAKFRQVIEIRDPNVRGKIHQTYRLNFLKDVVLARVLDDPTFGILNGFIFFNQSDIVSYMHSNPGYIVELFSGFKDGPYSPDDPLDERKRDVVLFLHQLMNMGKVVQMANRIALNRVLMEKGLLHVCEWVYTRHEAQILHAGAELLALAVEHDVNAFRLHCLKAQESNRKTLVSEIIRMMSTTENMGLLSQTMDTLRSILDVGMDESAFTVRKESQSAEAFMTYFYDHCCTQLYQPLLDLPEFKFTEPPAHPPKLSREKKALLQGLIELFSFTLTNVNQAHRAAYFLLSYPVSRKVLSLLYFNDKPLRHVALRFMRTCFRIQNHFVHRYFVKNDLLLPLLDLIDAQANRDNMLSSSYMEVLEQVRKDNIKPIINHLFENHKSRLDSLADRPFLRAIVRGLVQRYEANNEPPPPPPAQPDTSSKTWSMTAEAEEDSYFQASSDEEDNTIGPKPPSASPSASSPQKRKRAQSGAPTPPPKRPAAPSPGKMATGNASALGLDYDDGSDSEGSSGVQSPIVKPTATQTEDKPVRGDTPPEELEEDLGDVAMKMRAKRLREEEEEEGFAGLLVKQSKPSTGMGTRSKSPMKHAGAEGANGGTAAAVGVEDKPDNEQARGGGGKKADKKIRLSFSSFGRKTSGGK